MNDIENRTEEPPMYSYASLHHNATTNHKAELRGEQRHRDARRARRRSVGRRARKLFRTRSRGALAGSPPGGGGRLLQL